MRAGGLPVGLVNPKVAGLIRVRNLSGLFVVSLRKKRRFIFLS